ncbi:hypothetical protein DFS34DRAFT_593412 [Phlyctochytrium arcticum]|nr:hypothetical protein DFS34DRAFT_593412 [Phlyctochytrium arcticum]
MVTLGGNDEIVTMHLGKDPTKEAYDFLVSFYDTIGPRNFVSRIHHFVNLVQTRLHSPDPLLRDCTLDPFRNVKETLAAGEDPSVVLSWLQKVLQVIRPWHINAVGNDSLGIFVASLDKELQIVRDAYWKNLPQLPFSIINQVYAFYLHMK